MSDSVKRKRGRPPKIDRDQVIESAMRAWWSEGVQGLSLNEIARRTGLSKSSLYREFGGEDGLMAAALERYRSLSVVPMLELLEMDLPAAKTLQLLTGGIVGPNYAAGCLFTKLRLKRSAAGDKTTAVLDRMIAERRAAFAAWFARAREASGVVSPPSPTEAASYLDGQLMGMLVRRAAGDDPDDIGRDALLAFSALGV